MIFLLPPKTVARKLGAVMDAAAVVAFVAGLAMPSTVLLWGAVGYAWGAAMMLVVRLFAP